MTKKKRFSIWKMLKLPPQFLYAIGLGPIYGRIVLLLTTTGRKSGKQRVTPLQYEEIDGQIFIASARGTKSDWYRNIVANQNVKVRVKSRQFSGVAEPATDCKRIADFLEVRLERHPKIVGAILQRQGVSKNPSRSDLEKYASNRAMVIIRPLKEEMSAALASE
jgi:deazaflavin-dependent oxidoreductase (nitroreductase family)